LDVPTDTVYEDVPEDELKITSSLSVGLDAPVVAADMVWDAKLPPLETTQLFPDPLEMVPSNVWLFVQTRMPATRAGDPVVVSAVPEQEAVNTSADAADQLVVPVDHVPPPPTQ
jgi:hypothetical protein